MLGLSLAVLPPQWGGTLDVFPHIGPDSVLNSNCVRLFLAFFHQSVPELQRGQGCLLHEMSHQSGRRDSSCASAHCCRSFFFANVLNGDSNCENPLSELEYWFGLLLSLQFDIIVLLIQIQCSGDLNVKVSQSPPSSTFYFL